MNLLHKHGINVKTFRADSASYQFSTITTARKYFDTIFVRAKINASTQDAILNISNWEKIDNTEMQMGSTTFIPFQDAARRAKRKDLLEEYRLIVIKEERRDGQVNLFTGEACVYSAIMTNDFTMSEKKSLNFIIKEGNRNGSLIF
jgi:hypothetical protein